MGGADQHDGRRDDGHDQVKIYNAGFVVNGYSYTQPQRVFFQELSVIFGGHGSIDITDQVSPAVRQAQVAVAVADARCTESADLAGIYFAVLASYEQQLVNANQQALAAAVRKYRAAYRRELTKLPSLLKTAAARPAPTRRSG